MKHISFLTLKSVFGNLDPKKLDNSFELFGLDFMIDEDFRVWLIEVNTNPYIGIHNDSMKDLLPSMLGGLFKIVLDPVFENLKQDEIDNIH